MPARGGYEMTRREFVLGLTLAFSGCGSYKNEIIVGSKNFTEQLLLGEILKQAVAAVSRAEVEGRFYLAGTYICQQALLADRIDLYVEYTGTALTAILKENPERDSQAVYQTVRDQYRRRFGLEVMKPLGFDNSFAIIMRGDDARRYGIRTLSQLARVAPELRMGVGYEFLERPDGYPGLTKTYGLRFAEPPRVMDLGLLYRALQNRQVDVVAGNNTDGMIAALKLAVLDDDRHYFPPYDAVPIVRADTLQRHPEVRSAVDGLAGKIRADEMRRMNYAIDGERKDAAAVARDFLAREHIEVAMSLSLLGGFLARSRSLRK
jgi:osmoprotectant transport system substrate-binding protein